MKTEADLLAEFILDRTPTISKRGNSVSLDFDDVDAAVTFLVLLEDFIDAAKVDAEDARDAAAAKVDYEENGGIPWDDLKAELGLRRDGEPIDCSDIPEITGPLVPARLRRDAEGRLLPRAQAATNARDYIATLPEGERFIAEFDATQALAARRVRAEETRQALQDEINRGMRSTST